MDENEIGSRIVDCAVHLHMKLGPGLLETVHEVILAHLLRKEGLEVRRQVQIPIEFDGLRFEEAFRADMIVADKVLVELKSVQTVRRAHKKQVLTYLRLTDRKLGYLLNFGREKMKDGISRIINGSIN